MKIGIFVENLEVFDYKKGRDNYNFRWYALYKRFLENDIELETFNRCVDSSKYDIIIENGIQKCQHPNKYLLIIESTLIRPNDWNTDEHKNYKKVFCWDDKLVDNKKYFKLNYAFEIPKKIPKNFKNKKLCCTIAGNKSSNHSDELYTKRVDFIRWFEKNYPKDFDLFGTGWDQFRFGHSLLGRALNKIKFLRKSDHFPSYKGMVDSKFETMKNYKFSICYENIKDEDGYITEKIFDCLFAGCVPIYWGAKNVTDYIPKDCFIDKRDFSTYKELYDFMNKMDEGTYLNYLEKIERFLNSPAINSFDAETFADTIVDEIKKDFNGNC